MKKQIKRQIYLLSKRHMKPIEVVQYDYGVQLVFEVMDIDLDALALYATLFVRKPSGKFVFQEDNISITGNTVTINLENQALTEPGKAFFQIKFKANKTDLSTYSGMLTVEKSLEDSGAEESKTVIAAFDKLTDEEIAKIEEATRSQIELMKAEVEAKGETVLATIPDEYTEMYNRVNTLFNSVANAIKGTVSGSVVRVDDVSPVGHYLSVRANGKNLIPYPYTETTKTDNGISFTDNGNGTITANGTATSTATFNLNNNVHLIGGKTYVMNSNYMVISYKNEVGSAKWFVGTTPFVWNEEYTLIRAYLQISNGATVNNVVIKPQIEQGNIVTGYETWIDPTTATVKRLGKNLLNNEENSQTVNGVTFTVYDNGTVSASGTATADANFVIYKRPSLEVGENYVSSGNPDGASESKYYMRSVLAWGGINHEFYDYGTGIEFEVGGKVTAATLSIIIKAGVTTNGLLFKPMIRHISCDDSFEPYTEQTASPNDSGTVEGITPLSPTMTLLTDTEGVTIECEYNKDTGKVIENLTKAVVALGGVV